MIELTSRQRKLLEKYAQSMNPVVMVGQSGVTPAVEDMTDKSLASHELLKVSFVEFKEEKRELAAALAEKCGAAVVRIIGNKVILYRPAENPGSRKYEKELSKI